MLRIHTRDIPGILEMLEMLEMLGIIRVRDHQGSG
jgi:hypothetical protein